METNNELSLFCHGHRIMGEVVFTYEPKVIWCQKTWRPLNFMGTGRFKQFRARIKPSTFFVGFMSCPTLDELWVMMFTMRLLTTLNTERCCETTVRKQILNRLTDLWLQSQYYQRFKLEPLEPIPYCNLIG